MIKNAFDYQTLIIKYETEEFYSIRIVFVLK